MGYWAAGDGYIYLKENVTEEQVENAIKDCVLAKDTDFEWEYIDSTTEPRLHIWQNDDHWHEEDIVEFLNALIPLTENGDLFYEGDENCFWKYSFKNDWETDYGTIVYEDLYELTDKQLINALKKRGYKVISNGGNEL